MESHRAEIQHLTMQLEAKDTFCDAEKNRMLAELQADYQSTLPSLYNEQYDLGYWAGYAAGEGAAVHGDGSETLSDLFESPQQSVLVKLVEPSSISLLNEAVNTSTDGGAQVLVSPDTPTEEA